MRPWFLILGPFGVWLVLPSLAVAQEAPLLPRAPAPPAPWEVAWPKGLLNATPAADDAIDLSDSIEYNPLLDVDFLLGVPIAARVGVAVFRRHEQALLLEGMAGLDYLIVPFVAAGARYRFVACHTQRFELVIKLGVDAYAGAALFLVPIFGVGADVACIFLHNGPHHGFEWGVDLGAIGLIGARGDSSAVGVAPLVSFIFGFNF
ncbi:MAG TPA: hypothetical protein VH592_11980 [Gemmataceae bacterium]|jgi:hypothetical protein